MIRILILSTSLVALAPPAPAQSAVGVAAANKAALREPAASGYLHAVQVYPFADGVLYRLYTAPERISDIALQPGETLTSVAAGDTVRWTVGDTTSGSGEGKRTHILVKPFGAGLSTNLVITTDRRVYRIQLTSRAAAAMSAISWTYPADELLALARGRAAAEAAQPVSAAVEIERLNFHYRISGDKPAWLPLRAFDDGRQTWIEFPPAIAVTEAPPLFVLGDKGEAELVNYRVSGRYYIVDRLFGAAELRLGAKKQKIVRVTRLGDGVRRQGRGQ
ncbi:MAG TPA: P-type conjugative transfer protein TrbG [Sphingopyxis sp.]|uniref:P-type conjugative transfer protein TrbG n=1 Tax=Sphingopyxis sp. TaxID=1908224 RepID=UPI002C07FB70|nr:P-type conjugative transfer protein TrbG [Sphingopyxis sp.]HWT42705.1 P-type conjugative transfer protein TrbG [Sphingopyxis sp.]HWW57088.1 P-type conjugative transfer protein TrbG [Sphingopyxis sp.]